MKKRSIQSLVLNKTKISELQGNIGGRKDTDACPTASTCSCVSCRPACNLQQASQGCQR
ncbi:hypothetical protein IMCC3317_43350 [Kordia antarctica]|uniref:Uncharacterized protein n=1 Tax=Kordia antarctica TaxID=1218801 RepID=A0A7L4ZQL1_9FLAO|nr:hypothetical protein [Kordia antarctica]QHI38935.1 hypothetical protein IMCC3317_43350 [Kordia antarctica]